MVPLLLAWWQGAHPAVAAGMISARVTGMADAAVALPGIEALWSNPAGMIAHPQLSVGLSAMVADGGVRRRSGLYFQPDNGLGAGALGWRRSRWNPGEGIDQIQYTLAISHHVWSFGGTIGWVDYKTADGTGDAGAVVDFGVQFAPSAEVVVGAAINRVYSTLSDGLAIARPQASLGVSTTAVPDLTLALELADLTGPEVGLKVGVEYRLTEAMATRLGTYRGLSRGWESWTAGLGWHQDNWLVDWALVLDAGITHWIGIGWNL